MQVFKYKETRGEFGGQVRRERAGLTKPATVTILVVATVRWFFIFCFCIVGAGAVGS